MSEKATEQTTSSRGVVLVDAAGRALVLHNLASGDRPNVLRSPSKQSLIADLANMSGSPPSFSEHTNIIEKSVSRLRIPPSPGSLVAKNSQRPLEEQLFDATASVKILTSQVAMHIAREWRDKLFSQLDSLHDPVEWEPGDEPIKQASFATFLKAIVSIRPAKRPGLGLSKGGHLIAAWTNGDSRLTIEFLTNDRVRWVIGRRVDEEPEQIAGHTIVSKLSSALSPYNPQVWFAA